MSEAADFYQDHLDRVSRSFAFCIRQLPSPLREWVALSYLLCRVLDTIEDAPWPDQKSQMEAFDQFDRALNEPGSDVRFQHLLPDQITEGEKKLLADSPRLIGDLHDLDPKVRGVIRQSVLVMSAGMQYFAGQRRSGSLHLRTLSEVNQYCFFVAGIVGELLAKLVALVEPRFKLSTGELVRAHHFGLFLQKVNLLKDQVGDEQMGRHLIPSRVEVENSAEANARSALDFLLAVPLDQMEFRRFCAWSLYLGLEALYAARRSTVENRIVKVARERMNEILSTVESCLSDDQKLKSLFMAACEKLGWAGQTAPARSHGTVPEWLLSRYHGPLDGMHLGQLGIAH